MYNPEHYLHDIRLVKIAVHRIFKSFLEKYGFSDKYSENYFLTADQEVLNYFCNNFEVRFYISNREAYSMAFRKLEWPFGKIRYIESFMGLLMDENSKMPEDVKAIFKEKLSIQRYTENWYFEHMKTDLEFIMKYFPEVFTNQDLHVFE